MLEPLSKMTEDGRVDIQTKNAGYGGNANKNAGRNRTQGFKASDESNHIIQRVPQTESTPGKANVQCNLTDENVETVPSYDAKAVSQLEKKAFKEREDQYLDDILDLEEKLTGLGYTNPVHLKKSAFAAQPKMYDGDLLHNNKLGIHTTDSEETLKDAE
ncbi:hypothetical protein Tco_0001381 [Tanacetum coccineum]